MSTARTPVPVQEACNSKTFYTCKTSAEYSKLDGKGQFMVFLHYSAKAEKLHLRSCESQEGSFTFPFRLTEVKLYDIIMYFYLYE